MVHRVGAGESLSPAGLTTGAPRAQPAGRAGRPAAAVRIRGAEAGRPASRARARAITVGWSRPPAGARLRAPAAMAGAVSRPRARAARATRQLTSPARAPRPPNPAATSKPL